VPKTIYGIGTREFGTRDIAPNGSYVTTKFFVVFHIPLWPIESRRVRRVREEDHAYVRRLSLCWPQVIPFLAAGYGACLAILALAVTGVMLTKGHWAAVAARVMSFFR
jgi:hypothetical protein